MGITYDNITSTMRRTTRKGAAHILTGTAAGTILLFLSLFAVLSCSRDARFDIAGEGIEHRSELRVNAEINTGADAAENNSRAAITGTSFASGQTIGMYIVRHDRPGEYVPHATGMNNMRAVSGGGTSWTYNFSDNLSKSIDVLAISSVAKTSADIYAYSPWTSGTETPERILYQSSTQDDLMYAEENISGKNMNIKPDSLDKQDVPLHFLHALSMVRIGIKLANSGYQSPTLTSVRITKTDEFVETKMWSEGRFNALTGQFIEDTYRAMQYIDIPANKAITSTTSYAYFDCLLIPTEVKNDGDLRIELTVNSQSLLEPYEIQLSDVLSSDGKKGFQPGYIYTLLFSIDNYLRFRPLYITVSDEWIDADLEEHYI